MASSLSGGTSVDISQLPLPQLNHLAQQTQQEIDFLTNSMNQLKLAQGKFVESQESLGQLNEQSLQKDILVPLTSSMYVPGRLSNVENVLIDIGTGYYVDMTVNGGKEYFKRKIEFLAKQIEKLQPVLQEKYKVNQVIVEMLQMKVQAQMASQSPTAATAK